MKIHEIKKSEFFELLVDVHAGGKDWPAGTLGTRFADTNSGPFCSVEMGGVVVAIPMDTPVEYVPPSQ